MRRLIALTSVLVLLGSGAALAARHPSKHDRGHSRVHVLSVHRNAERAVELDLDHSATPAKPPPDSIGDEHVVTADFYQGTKQVGFDGGVCTLVRAPSWFQCLATNNFAEGRSPSNSSEISRRAARITSRSLAAPARTAAPAVKCSSLLGPTARPT